MVWADNWETLQFWLKIATQWRAAGGMGVSYIGLDYNALFHLFKLYGIEDQAALFEDIHAMEIAALTVLNKAK